ncbi:MAG: hypothetical protein RMI49_04930 [Candidatus Caldarchaeum sp.]|nr:hypothetical protein [Candidatus Caldarchaeum sp.]
MNPKPVVVYSAPTLRGISDELVRLADFSVDVRVYGSVFATNLIKSGKTPDLLLSVDSELKKGLEYRDERVIGIYRLVVVCNKYFDGVEDLKTARLGIADPNLAPIGYRALAALYLLSIYEGLDVVDEVEAKLNVKYQRQGDSVFLDARTIEASGRFYMRPDLDVVSSLLEAGTVDCIFAHMPFVITRELPNDFNLVELPECCRFEKDPPIDFYVDLSTGRVRVGRFEAVALSFTENGDKLLRLIDKIDVSKYGFRRMS